MSALLTPAPTCLRCNAPHSIAHLEMYLGMCERRGVMPGKRVLCASCFWDALKSFEDDEETTDAPATGRGEGPADG